MATGSTTTAWRCCGTGRRRREADTSLIAYQRLGQLRDPAKLTPWLYAIARSRCLRRIKDRGRQRPTDDLELLSPTESAATGEVESAELQQLVWDGAAGLAGDDRAVLDLHLRHGLSGAELAAASIANMAPAATSDRVPPRAYRSPKRDEQARQTRRQIIAAATEQFRTAGYSGTTTAAIARAAGVSQATVELVFGTKAALLKAAIDVAIAGDNEPVPVLRRASTARIERARTAETFMARTAEAVVETAGRAAALVVVAFDAARGDDRLAPLAVQLKAQRATVAASIVDGLSARVPLRDGVDRAHAIDTVWLLMDPVVFDRLTTDRGWTPRRFGAWFAESILRLLTTA